MSGQGFQSFDNVAADVVLALSYNASGTRFATTSADQRIRVYDVDSDDGPGQLRLVDQWRGHDAEIHDVIIPAPFSLHSFSAHSPKKERNQREKKNNKKDPRSNGSTPSKANTSAPLAATINSNSGAKTLYRAPPPVDASAASSRSRPSTGLRTWPLSS